MSLRRILSRLVEGREEKPRSLYVHRPLVNGDEFLDWAREQGFKKVTDPKDLHATVLYSKDPVLWSNWSPAQEPLQVIGGPRLVEPLGDEGAVVLQFTSSDLQARHKEFRSGGGSHDYPSYKTHVTITYDAEGLDTEEIEPYAGPLVFGPEEFAVIDSDWKPAETKT